MSTDQQITWYDERPEEHSQENDILLVIFKRLLSLTIEKYKTVYCKTIVVKNELISPLFENNFKIITKGIYSPDLTYKNFENQKKVSLCKYLGCVIPFLFSLA